VWLGDIVRGQIVCGINGPRGGLLRSSADLQSPGLVSAAQGEFSFSKIGCTFCESRCQRAALRQVLRAACPKWAVSAPCLKGASGLESHIGTERSRTSSHTGGKYALKAIAGVNGLRRFAATGAAAS
jgi:hypothetical protein